MKKIVAKCFRDLFLLGKKSYIVNRIDPVNGEKVIKLLTSDRRKIKTFILFRASSLNHKRQLDFIRTRAAPHYRPKYIQQKFFHHLLFTR